MLENTESLGMSLENKENSNSELLERHEVPGTPLFIMGNKDQGYFLVMGKHRVSDIEDSVDTIVNLLETWEYRFRIQFNMTVVITESLQEIRIAEQ